LDTGGSFTTIDPPGARPFGSVANGINNNGQIVGYFGDASGNDEGFLATPVPEPASVLTLAT
jgi:probable HAF family extracellular repeat protein